jgi:hypothetical protein
VALRIYDLSGEDITPRVIKLDMTAKRATATVMCKSDEGAVLTDASGHPQTFEVEVSLIAGDHRWTWIQRG